MKNDHKHAKAHKHSDMKKPSEPGAKKTPQQDDRDLDDALDQSFPASDPAPQTQPTKKVGSADHEKKAKK